MEQTNFRHFDVKFLLIFLLTAGLTACQANKNTMHEYSTPIMVDELARALMAVHRNVDSGFEEGQIAKIEMNAATLATDLPRNYSYKVSYGGTWGKLKISISGGTSTSHQLSIQSDIPELIDKVKGAINNQLKY